MIHPHGYWCGDQVHELHVFDPSLAEELALFFKKEKARTVADFGCGLGDYVKVLLKENILTEGFDGHPNTEKLTNGVARVLDLSQPFDLGKRFDWVMSLEVGEHIPKKYEKQFLENLNRHALKGIILSWAIPGQKGHGHCNLQSNASIKKKMMLLGYVNDEKVEKMLRLFSTCPWFQNTLMVFRKSLN